jgi:hypothetical protein
MHKSVLAALVATGALLVALAPAASAASLKAAEGAPTITEDSPTGYYIFHSDDGFHLRTHGPKAQHDFDAVLKTDGTFENVDVVKLEAGDRVDLVDGGHKMLIHFHTFDLTDGVNFSIRGGTRLHLNLKLDDTTAPTNDIFLGAQGKHPRKNPFSVKL